MICLKLKKVSFLDIVKRTNIILTFGLLICSITLLVVDTVSFFTSGTSGNVEVSTAAVHDIIKTIEISEQNPKNIRLVKSDTMTADPVIFFSVEGDAAQYISYINPVRLDKSEVTVPIKLNISLPNCIGLLNSGSGSKSDPIKGKIRIKFLNEYIDEPREFEFSPEYLLNEYADSLKKDDKNTKAFSEVDKERRKKITPYITDIITYTAGFGAWDDEEYEKSETGELSEDGEDDNVKKLPMTDYQASIIDIIMPKMRPHLNGLYSMIENLKNEIKAKNEQIDEYASDIKKLKDRIEELENKNSGSAGAGGDLLPAQTGENNMSDLPPSPQYGGTPQTEGNSAEPAFRDEGDVQSEPTGESIEQEPSGMADPKTVLP